MGNNLLRTTTICVYYTILDENILISQIVASLTYGCGEKYVRNTFAYSTPRIKSFTKYVLTRARASHIRRILRSCDTLIGLRRAWNWELCHFPRAHVCVCAYMYTLRCNDRTSATESSTRKRILHIYIKRKKVSSVQINDGAVREIPDCHQIILELLQTQVQRKHNTYARAYIRVITLIRKNRHEMVLTYTQLAHARGPNNTARGRLLSGRGCWHNQKHRDHLSYGCDACTSGCNRLYSIYGLSLADSRKLGNLSSFLPSDAPCASLS